MSSLAIDWAHLKLIGAKAPFAADLLCPDPAVSGHAEQGVRVQAEHGGGLPCVEQPVELSGQVRADSLGELSDRNIIEGPEEEAGKRSRG